MAEDGGAFGGTLLEEQIPSEEQVASAAMLGGNPVEQRLNLERVSPKWMDGETIYTEDLIRPLYILLQTFYYTASKPIQEFCFREVFWQQKKLTLFP